MNARDDKAYKKALCEVASLPEPRPAAAFWQDFRARASLTVQQAPESAAAPGSVFLSLRWAGALAALVLVVAAIGLYPWAPAVQVAAVPAPAPAPAAAPTALPSALSKVEEVEVLSEYSSVMIVEDAENGGTVIWVASADIAMRP